MHATCDMATPGKGGGEGRFSLTYGHLREDRERIGARKSIACMHAYIHPKALHTDAIGGRGPHDRVGRARSIVFLIHPRRGPNA
jgi:hypothetical protein